MFPDRPLQLKILEELKKVYPEQTSVEHLACYSSDFDFMANVFYLLEHGLINGTITNAMGAPRSVVQATITMHGIDFLADDGGLSAILNKVHIKFDEEDLTRLLTSKLVDADLPPEQKSELMKTIRNLPAEGVKTIYKYLLNLGLKNVQDMPQLIQNVQDTLI